jgi:hypothetical protein
MCSSQWEKYLKRDLARNKLGMSSESSITHQENIQILYSIIHIFSFKLVISRSLWSWIYFFIGNLAQTQTHSENRTISFYKFDYSHLLVPLSIEMESISYSPCQIQYWKLRLKPLHQRLKRLMYENTLNVSQTESSVTFI